MSSVHGWSSVSPSARPRSLVRGCATVAFAVLLVYGIGAILQAILPLSPGIRGNEVSYVAIGLVFLFFAGAVWALWLRSTTSASTATPIRAPRERSPLALLMEHASNPDETSTAYLPTAWLVRLDLAFREHLWVRLATLLVGMIAVTLVVLMAFGTGVLR